MMTDEPELVRQLREWKAQFALTAHPDRVALYQARIDELRASFALERTPRAGDPVPDFSLPDQHGRTVVRSEILRRGAAVVTFYRGGWCPYCNLQLQAYQVALPEMEALGARLVAISPELPDQSVSTAERNGLAFDVLSDVGNRVARMFGLAHGMPEDLREAMRAVDKALPGFNGDDSWELPVPATYVVAPGGRIVLAHVEVDYRMRLPPEGIVAALRTLAPA